MGHTILFQRSGAFTTVTIMAPNGQIARSSLSHVERHPSDGRELVVFTAHWPDAVEGQTILRAAINALAPESL